MGDGTAIEWTDATWNPVRGCERVSPGCVNCYAEVLAARFSLPGMWGEGLATWVTRPDGSREARWTRKIVPQPELLDAPKRWKKPRRIFVNSMSDLFHERVPEDFIAQVFAVMAECPQHTFQILTKRAERMRQLLLHDLPYEGPQWPLKNVWLGVSTEDQATFDERVEHLGATPAAIRFVSAEPLLGEIHVGNAFDDPPEKSEFLPLDWVIVGGESGPGARPTRVRHVRSLVRQCQAAGVPVFVKQMGAYVVDSNDAGFDGCDPGSWPLRVDGCDPVIDHDINGYLEEYQGADCRVHLVNRKGGDMAEWPEDLRVRELPA